MQIHKLHKINRRGDTIVEVLIAIAIVSSVLAGAFTVTQKSTHAVRSSQERGEALQMLQGQVEQVRTAALKATSTSDSVFDTSPKYFCMNPDTAERIDSPTMATLPNASADNYANYATGCKGVGQGSLYNIAITYDTPSKVFKFFARWDSSNSGKNQVQLSYRIYPGAVTYAAAAMSSNPGPAPVGNAQITEYTDGNTCWPSKGWNNASCWNPTVINTSTNPVGTVVSCTYNWGDGSPPETYAGTSAQCRKNEHVLHQYTVRPRLPGSPPYVYAVTITNTMTTGYTTPPFTLVLGVPY